MKLQKVFLMVAAAVIAVGCGNRQAAQQQESEATDSVRAEVVDPAIELIDQFYKEYSYLVRNSRIANREVNMELAQLLAIDKTKKVNVGDVTGFIRKMQYTVSNETGLGKTAMEILYI